MVVVVIFFSFRRRSRDAVAAPAFSVSSPATRAIAIARQRSKRKRNVLCGRARVLLPRVVLVRIFPNNNIITGLSLSLSGERVSLFLRLYYDKRLLMFISSDSIARGVCICRSCRPSYGRTLARFAEFLREKEGKKEPKKEFKSTATTAIITTTAATTTAHTARVLRLCLCV